MSASIFARKSRSKSDIESRCESLLLVEGEPNISPLSCKAGSGLGCSWHFGDLGVLERDFYTGHAEAAGRYLTGSGAASVIMGPAYFREAAEVINTAPGGPPDRAMAESDASSAGPSRTTASSRSWAVAGWVWCTRPKTLACTEM